MSETQTYDPTAEGETVDKVNAYLAEHPDQVEAVLAAERQGEARKGILGAYDAEGSDKPEDDSKPGQEDGDKSPLTTKGASFEDAAKAATPDPKGYLGESPEATRTGRRDKGLSQRNPAVMNQGGTVPNGSPRVDDSEAIKALKRIKD